MHATHHDTVVPIHVIHTHTYRYIYMHTIYTIHTDTCTYTSDTDTSHTTVYRAHMYLKCIYHRQAGMLYFRICQCICMYLYVSVCICIFWHWNSEDNQLFQVLSIFCAESSSLQMCACRFTDEAPKQTICVIDDINKLAWWCSKSYSKNTMTFQQDCHRPFLDSNTHRATYRCHGAYVTVCPTGPLGLYILGENNVAISLFYSYRSYKQIQTDI
jgi:hypothetical protein